MWKLGLSGWVRGFESRAEMDLGLFLAAGTHGDGIACVAEASAAPSVRYVLTLASWLSVLGLRLEMELELLFVSAALVLVTAVVVTLVMAGVVCGSAVF